MLSEIPINWGYNNDDLFKHIIFGGGACKLGAYLSIMCVCVYIYIYMYNPQTCSKRGSLKGIIMINQWIARTLLYGNDSKQNTGLI